MSEIPAAGPLPVHLHPRYLALVMLGGAFGTAARELVYLALPDVGRFPAAAFTVNVLGAFLLGMLLETLALRGPDRGARRNLRLLVGTGFLGGFTTYSTLTVDTALLTGGDRLGLAVLYAAGTLVLGAVASAAGIALSARRTRRTAR